MTELKYVSLKDFQNYKILYDDWYKEAESAYEDELLNSYLHEDEPEEKFTIIRNFLDYIIEAEEEELKEKGYSEDYIKEVKEILRYRSPII